MKNDIFLFIYIFHYLIFFFRSRIMRYTVKFGLENGHVKYLFVEMIRRHIDSFFLRKNILMMNNCDKLCKSVSNAIFILNF